MTATNWEYTSLTHPTLRIDDLVLQLNAMGSLGWEMCGFASADPTLGINSYTAVLRRPAAQYPQPADLNPAWHPDPSKRHERRYWDGLRWSQHVVDGETTDTDWPNVRT